MENVKEKEVLINRSQMLKVAQEFNIFVSRGTIHRWANEPKFPCPIGKDGKSLLYLKVDYVNYLQRWRQTLKQKY